MITAATHPREAERLRLIEASFALEASQEPAFGEIVRLAAQLADMPVAMINVVARDRQVTLASHGMPHPDGIARDRSICAHTILGDGAMAVADARVDQRFFDLPSVLAEGGLRAYHGVPLRLGEGIAIGTLCVIDHRPRRLADPAAAQLESLAGLVVRVLELRADTTRMRRVALPEAAERVQLLLDGGGQGIWDWNAANGTVYLSPHWRAMLGYPEAGAETGLADWLALVHPEDRERVPADMEHVSALQTGAHAVDYRMRTADGSYRWIRDRARVVRRDPVGAPLRVLGSYRDVTDERREAEALRAAKSAADARLERRSAELEHALAELELFASTLSHDLRAPIRACGGYAAMLAEQETGLSAEGARMLAIMGRKTSQIGDMVESILDYLRGGRQPLRLQSVDLHGLFGAAWSDLAPQRNGRPIEFRLGALPPCRGDERLLRQVVDNLLGNAVKYTGQRNPAVIEVGGEAKAGRCQYWVRDNGIGFDPDEATRLFQPFQRLNAEFPGLGLGLASVRRAVERINGRVSAEALPDGGACFGFELPRAASTR